MVIILFTIIIASAFISGYYLVIAIQRQKGVSIALGNGLTVGQRTSFYRLDDKEIAIIKAKHPDIPDDKLKDLKKSFEAFSVGNHHAQCAIFPIDDIGRDVAKDYAELFANAEQYEAFFNCLAPSEVPYRLHHMYNNISGKDIDSDLFLSQLRIKYFVFWGGLCIGMLLATFLLKLF